MAAKARTKSNGKGPPTGPTQNIRERAAYHKQPALFRHCGEWLPFTVKVLQEIGRRPCGGAGCTANCTGGRWSWRQPARARQGRNEEPGLLGRVFELDQLFFHDWQKRLGIEKLLGFLQRAKSRPGVGAARGYYSGWSWSYRWNTPSALAHPSLYQPLVASRSLALLRQAAQFLPTYKPLHLSFPVPHAHLVHHVSSLPHRHTGTLSSHSSPVVDNWKAVPVERVSE